MLFSSVIKGMKRLTDEAFDKYKDRIGAEAIQLKNYLRGTFLEKGKTYIPDKVEFRITSERRRHLKKMKAKRKNLVKMQKQSRRVNFQRAA